MPKKTFNGLKKYMKEHKMTANELGTKTGVSATSIRRIVDHEVNDLKLSTILAIEKVTGLKVDEYFDVKLLTRK